jgi:hypothetical protein
MIWPWNIKELARRIADRKWLLPYPLGCLFLLPPVH